MTAQRPKRHWALVGHWEGSPRAILRGNYVPPFARWFAISRREWRALRKEGFYTRRSRHRPTALLSPEDRIKQRRTPITCEW